MVSKGEIFVQFYLFCTTIHLGCCRHHSITYCCCCWFLYLYLCVIVFVFLFHISTDRVFVFVWCANLLFSTENMQLFDFNFCTSFSCFLLVFGAVLSRAHTVYWIALSCARKRCELLHWIWHKFVYK